MNNSGEMRCWNSKGVWGNSECPKLSSAIHCANCEVYSDAGREIFEREIPQGYFKTWVDSVDTLSFASVSRGGDSYFAFRCAGELFALPTNAVFELSASKMIHKIPYRRGGAIAGLVNINGELVVAVDLPSLFDLNGKAENPKCIVVCAKDGEKFAFSVDSARGSITADDGEVFDVKNLWYADKKFKFNGEDVVLINFEMLVGAITKKRV